MKLFIALEMTFKCHSRSLAMSYFIRSAGPETGKIRLYIYFQTNIDRMTLKVNQDHYQWLNLIGHIPLSVSSF